MSATGRSAAWASGATAVDELSATVERATCETPDWTFAEDLLREMMAAGRIGPVLRAAVDRVNVVRDLILASKVHGNGFDSLVIAGSAVGWQARLNIWDGARARHPETIHNHRADFATTMLAGSYTAEYFDFDEDGPLHHVYRYSAGATRQSFSMRLEGSAGLVKTGEHRVVAGETYLLERSRLHRVVPSAGAPTVTMVLRDRPQANETYTVTDEPLFWTPEVHEAGLTLDSYIGRISRVLEFGGFG